MAITLAIDETELTRRLQDLIRIDSVNPSLVSGGAGEAEIADYVADYWRGLGLDVQLQTAAPGRPNVIGVIEGARPGRAFLLNAHLDTVSVEGMTDPFVPRVDHGRVYGRGSMDTKGGLAAMLMAGKVLMERRAEWAGQVILTGVADEEYASIGTEALVRDWRADAAIVLEPTGLHVCTAHKGFVWLEVETEGRAAHGSRPDFGIDAIMKMGAFLHELAGLEAALRQSSPHPLLGTGSLHASLIHGGRELSSYPDRCVLQIERRTIPGESSEKAGAEVERIIERLQAADPHFRAQRRMMFQREPYEIAATHPFVATVCQAVAQATGRPAQIGGLTAWADSALFGAAGVPTVVFGPGGEGLHGLVEYVNLSDVALCAQVLVQSVAEFLGKL